MKLSACRRLLTTPENNTWYRAIRVQHLSTALQTTQSQTISGRFNPGSASGGSFRVLYLAENHLAALYEVGALFGPPTRPPGAVSVALQTWSVLNVQVTLARVADLTAPDAQSALGTTAQELTGDWEGYELRGTFGAVPYPIGKAPTQALGEALYAVPRIEGFRSYSAPLPYHRVLVIFPDKLDPASHVRWQDPATGQWHAVL